MNMIGGVGAAQDPVPVTCRLGLSFAPGRIRHKMRAHENKFTLITESGV